MKFSVLISVYDKEDPEVFNEALESIIENQSIKPNEVVIVKDGPLTEELDNVIDDYKERFNSIVKIIPLKTNMGLGEALNIGLDNCSFDIVARMDSDDISHKLRFEKQLKVLSENQEIDLVGGSIAEFFETKDDIKFIRKVPSTNQDIKKMIKRRNPINHVSVMFRKSTVLEAGGYKHLYFLEDYYLWVRMVSNNFNLVNIEDVLVYVRTGESMFKRRSNPEYIRSWYKLQRVMKKNNLINNIDFIVNMINIFGFVLMPSQLKRGLYSLFLRDKPSLNN